MKTVRSLIRAAVSVLAATSIALVVAGTVAAASPDTVGGRLAAVGNTVSVTSQGTLPVHVILTADVVHLSTDAFDLAPGATRDLTFTGDPLGRVYATFSAGSSGQAADANTLTLSVGLKPYVPPFGFADLMPGGSVPFVWIALLILAFLLPARWFRRNVRIVRKAA